MATVDLGKIKFTWRSAFATGNTYEADDVVSHSGSTWIYVNATSKNGSTAGAPSASNSAHWELMADGTNPLTTQGDIMTHDGSNAVRVPRGVSGSIVKVSGSDVVFGTEQGYVGHKHLLSNYGKTPSDPSASNTYGDNGKYPWLANYSNNWIPECGTPNPACGPVKNSDIGVQYNSYRMCVYLNENHELVAVGDDDFGWLGSSTGVTYTMGVINNISAENGGMRDGDYFVRLWVVYNNIWLLTKDGDLFSAGDNAYGQLGTGGTTDRYMLAKIATLGPDATHGGVSTQIAGFHVGNQTDNSAANYASCYAIDTSGRLFVWGYNAAGKLGIGNTTNQSYPTLASAVSNVVSVSGGHQVAYVIDSSGNLFRTGANQNGQNQGSATTSWTDTNQNNAYQVLCIDGYYGGSSRNGWSMYMNTSGEIYGIGNNAVGQLGDGTVTEKSAWTRCGGSLTFSSFYASSNSYYTTVAALGGTPGNSNNDFYNWGYNGSGQLGQGNTTNLSTPTQPQATSLYSHTVTSTSSNSAPSKTDIPCPVNDIHHVYPLQGCNAYSSNCMMIEDQYGRIWQAGNSNTFDYHEASTASANITNYYLDPSPFNATGTISGTHWAGESVVTIHNIYHTGNDYGSEGNWIMVLSDGRVFGKGYNAQGQLGDAGVNWIGQWKQLTP